MQFYETNRNNLCVASVNHPEHSNCMQMFKQSTSFGREYYDKRWLSRSTWACVKFRNILFEKVERPENAMTKVQQRKTDENSTLEDDHATKNAQT